MMIPPELEAAIQRYETAIAAIENTIQTAVMFQSKIIRDRRLNNAVKSATRDALNTANASKLQLQQAAIEVTQQVMTEQSVEAIAREINLALNTDATQNVETQNIDAEIDKIIDTAAKELTNEQLLEVLTARDAVQLALSQETPIFTGQLLATLKRGDRYLKSRKWLELISQIDLEEWREIFHPPETAWWWYLELPPSANETSQVKSVWNRFDLLCNFLTWVFLTISVSLVVEIASRFLSGGSDPGGVFAVVASTLLTFISGQKILPEKAKKYIQNILNSFKVNTQYFEEASFTITGTLCLGILIFYIVGLPKIAIIYNHLGEKQIPALTTEAIDQDTSRIPERQLLTKAEYYFSRALKLDPDYAKAYDNLGQVYEQLQELEKAEQQYQLAMKLQYLPAYPHLANVMIERGNYKKADDIVRQVLDIATNTQDGESKIHNEKILIENLEVLNKLARAYNLQKNTTDAISLLHKALKNSNVLTKEERYNLITNMGWAYLNKESYYTAKNVLLGTETIANSAESLQSKPDHYCLLGLAYRELNKNPDNRKIHENQEKFYWEQCSRLSKREIPEQLEWILEAEKRLRLLK
jgi:tetratricopeptide (TPR) repeat protein